MPQNKELLGFIKEARRRGFSDMQIRKVLLDNGWPSIKIDDAMNYLNSSVNLKLKNQVTIFLSNEMVLALNKRAKKNLMTVPEQIEDILRRSCIRKKTTLNNEKIDDLLVTCFSRSQRGRR